MIFAGDGPGRSGQTQVRGRAEGCVGSARWASPIGSATRQAIRGGYGIYYAHVAFGQFGGPPTAGFASNPFAPNNTNGIFPALPPGPGVPAGPSPAPAVHRPDHHLGGHVIAVTPDGLTLPRFQNWSVTYQRQLTDNMMLDISYIGNRGSRLNHHCADARRRREHERSRACWRWAPRCCSRTSTRPLARPPASRPRIRGSPATWPRRCGSSRSTRTSSGAACRPAESQYHALEVVLERRFSRGLQARVGYTYSQLMNNGAESAQGSDGRNGGVQNPADPLPWISERRRHAARVADRVHLGDARVPSWTRAMKHCSAAGTSAASCATRAAGR